VNRKLTLFHVLDVQAALTIAAYMSFAILTILGKSGNVVGSIILAMLAVLCFFYLLMRIAYGILALRGEIKKLEAILTERGSMKEDHLKG